MLIKVLFLFGGHQKLLIQAQISLNTFIMLTTSKYIIDIRLDVLQLPLVEAVCQESFYQSPDHFIM